MPLWLILIAIGVILAIIGFAGVGNILIWIGVIILVIGLIGTLLGRRGTRV
jgi:membrane protein implicated in regulation of membrane protease activity